MTFSKDDIAPYGSPTLPVHKPAGPKPDLITTVQHYYTALYAKSFADMLPYYATNFVATYRGDKGPDDPKEVKRGMDFHWKICKEARLTSVSLIEEESGKGRKGVRVKGEQLVDDWLEIDMVYWFEEDKEDGVWRMVEHECTECGYPERIIEQMMKDDF